MLPRVDFEQVAQEPGISSLSPGVGGAPGRGTRTLLEALHLSRQSSSGHGPLPELELRLPEDLLTPTELRRRLRT